MSLPILVPTVHELLLLGVAVRARLHRRYLHWRTQLGQEPTRVRPRRPTRFAEPTTAEVRAHRVAHWGARCRILEKPPSLPAIPWRPRTASTYRLLLRDGERLLKRLLLRRQQSANVSPQMVSTIAATLDSSTWRVRVDPVQRDVLVFMLISMYWRGCRHPACLYGPTLHPPTALIRWLSRFSVQHQVDHGRQILEQFTREETRVHECAQSVVERMLHRVAGSTCAILLLPDMLRAIEPNDYT